MRMLAALAAAGAALFASAAFAASPPTYTIVFTGTGTEHHVDEQQNIQDSGLCDSAEHVDVTAGLSWQTAWAGFRPAARTALAQPASIAGATVSGTHVKDACGLPLDEAPEGWVSQGSCSSPLVSAGSPQLTVVHRSATTLELAVSAPAFAVPVAAGCSLNVRNDQLATHVVVPLKKLLALETRGSLTLAVGTARPGPGDLFSPSIDCSQPTKPYEGYRTADHCQDTLSWSGTLTITRAS
jgi:hypothetical protein